MLQRGVPRFLEAHDRTPRLGGGASVGDVFVPLYPVLYSVIVPRLPAAPGGVGKQPDAGVQGEPARSRRHPYLHRLKVGVRRRRCASELHLVDECAVYGRVAFDYRFSHAFVRNSPAGMCRTEGGYLSVQLLPAAVDDYRINAAVEAAGDVGVHLAVEDDAAAARRRVGLYIVHVHACRLVLFAYRTIE